MLSYEMEEYLDPAQCSKGVTKVKIIVFKYLLNTHPSMLNEGLH